VVLVLGGLCAGVLAVLAIAARVAGDDDPGPAETLPSIELTFPAVDHDPAAAEALVIAWNRWRTGTFVSSGTWTRTIDGADEPLSGDVFMAQDPPRRLVVRLGAVTESIDGTVTTCDAPSDAIVVPACTDGGQGRSYDERLDTEMQLVLEYIIGNARLYDVEQHDSCFQLELREAVLRSPWGRASQFCFDDETGALASSLVRRQSAVDEERTTGYRTDVTDDDFLR
jgi:hypothetical protein